MSAKNPKCVSAGCHGLPKRRGLCPNCYAAAYRLVRAGRTTWEKLIAAGLCKKAQTRRRNPLSVAAAAIEGK